MCSFYFGIDLMRIRNGRKGGRNGFARVSDAKRLLFFNRGMIIAMCEAEGIRNLVANRRLCPEKAVETHLFSNNLDVPLPASCRNKGTECFRTRIARALIVVSCPNEKDSSPGSPKLTHAGIAHD